MKGWALITGASSGIGREFAHQLAAQGYHLIITARSEDRLEELKTEILAEYLDSQVRVIVGDLTKPEFRTSLAQTISNQDNFSMLVNNAGFGIPRKFLDVSVSDHLAMTALHVESVVELSYAALESYRERKGAIINVASVAAFMGSGMYSGTKAFQVSLGRRLTRYVKQQGMDVVIQALCPGFTVTGFHSTPYYEGQGVRRAPKWLWLDVTDVVRDSLSNIPKRKIVVIPSLRYKLLVFLARIGILRR